MTAVLEPVVATTTYRRASSLDLPSLLAMVERFIATTSYAKYVGSDATTITKTLTWMLDYDGAAIFVAELGAELIGMLGLVEYTHPLSGRLAASELFWWLNPEHRGHGVWLLKRGESWARSRACVTMQMIAPIDNQAVHEMYARIGYVPVETAYSKELA